MSYDASEARILRRLDTAGKPDDFELTKTRYGFGVSWDPARGRPEIDVDLQCVVVDKEGVIIDCAYYNNLKAARGITHSGDEAEGKPGGIQEMVWVHMQKLPPNVAVLVFVIAAYSGGHLQDVSNGKFRVLEESERKELARFDLERSAASVDVVAAMFQTGGQWKLRIIEEPAQQGQHFMDILPLISDTIRIFLPRAPKRQKVAFAMEKGSVLDLPTTLNNITVGLGWDTDEGKCDLDVSAVLFDKANKFIEPVYYGRLKSEKHGIHHSGDNLTGEGEGDDEQIRVELTKIGQNVEQVFFVVNIYTTGVTFRRVANPYCRVVDEATGQELCNFKLRQSNASDNALIISKIQREVGGRWGFHALGIPAKGRTFKDSLPYMQEATKLDTRQLRQMKSQEFQDVPGASGRPGKPPGQGQDCCIIS
jgi:tellurium resistance protein TerZ